MKVLLDTSAYSALHRGDTRILEVLRQSTLVGISAVVLGELRSGFRQGNRTSENEAELVSFLTRPSVRVLDLTSHTALQYAEIDVYLRKKGRPIPRNDVWIAASALEHGLVLITTDQHFRQIPLLLIRP